MFLKRARPPVLQNSAVTWCATRSRPGPGPPWGRTRFGNLVCAKRYRPRRGHGPQAGPGSVLPMKWARMRPTKLIIAANEVGCLIMRNLILHMIHKIRLLKDLGQQFLLLNLQAIKGFALLFLLTSCFLHKIIKRALFIGRTEPGPGFAKSHQISAVP